MHDDKLTRRVSQIEKALSQQQQTGHNTSQQQVDWRRKYDELAKDYEKLKLLDEQRHTANRSYKSVNADAADADKRNGELNRGRCYGCGETGHFRRSCPNGSTGAPKRNQQSQPSESRQSETEEGGVKKGAPHDIFNC